MNALKIAEVMHSLGLEDGEASARMAAAANSTARALPRASATPPASDLCEICGETIFSATG